MAHTKGVAGPTFTLGDRLQKAREWAGIKSADRMAELLTDHGIAVGRGAVSAWERDANQPTRYRVQEVVAAYAEICGVSESFLWDTEIRCFSWMPGVTPDRRHPELPTIPHYDGQLQLIAC